MRQTYAEAKRGIRYKKCLRHPEQHLEVGLDHRTLEYVPWCVQCGREGKSGPALGRDDYIAEKEWDMTTREMATRNVQILNLKVIEIRTLLDVSKASDNEILGFIRFCQGADANPYLKEAYLIKYDVNKPASIVLAIQWYVKRAAGHPSYQGFQAGVLVKVDQEIKERTGAVVWPGEELFGGWCRVFVTGIPAPYELPVMLSEYNRKQAMWLTHPATMIMNTAIRQTIRRAFPDFAEQEDRAELPVTIEGEFEVLSDTEPIPEPPQAEAPPPQRPPSTARAAPEGAASPQRASAPPQRRFHTVTEFWTATEEAGWTREQVAGVLGPSIGAWLNDKSKEWGRFATWDDAFEALVGELGIAEQL